MNRDMESMLFLFLLDCSIWDADAEAVSCWLDGSLMRVITAGLFRIVIHSLLVKSK